jgi:3-methyladenine DNA glycosylase AlkD
MNLSNLKKEIRSIASPEKAKVYQWFFKTGPGQYGEGDVFIGLTMPQVHSLVKKYNALPFPEIQKLLQSKIHEERSIALLILVKNYPNNPEKIYDFYLQNTKYINNWDLVDLTAHKVVGRHLENRDRKILYKLAKSKSLWERRISIISTFWFHKEKDFKDSMALAEILVQDHHDLMHKAVGWVLREVGKSDLALLEKFLKKHCKTMPRTMLRYSIEKFPEEKRQKYLKGLI